MKLTDWQTCQKEGDVKDNEWDKNLGKKFIQIKGTNPSNYI
jgi:hypothetical protein